MTKDKAIDTSAVPRHYTDHVVQPIDLIADYKLNYCIGNVVKYASRYAEKNGREDLCKCAWYLLYELGVPKERVNEIV